MLIDCVSTDSVLSELYLGLNWSTSTVTRTTQVQHGVCFSPKSAPRTIPWSGNLRGSRVRDLAPWVRYWDDVSATVGALVINTSANYETFVKSNPDICTTSLSEINTPKHLSVFEYFGEKIAGKRVAVIGHYPNLRAFSEAKEWHCIERNPSFGDLPDTAAAFILPRMDWVFITASSISNKSLPTLLALSSNANVVLMGPSLPWLRDWKVFGGDYLAGIRVMLPERLFEVVAEAGGIRLFDEACHYYIAKL